MTFDDRLKSHYESLARAIGFTKGADTKAAPVLALQVALVGTLAARTDRLQDILVEGEWSPERMLLIAAIVFYVVFLAAAVVVAIRVYVPVNPRTGKSLIYFEDIAAQDFASFEARAREMRPAMLEGQLLDQIHRVSKIASLKMQWVRCTLRLSVVSSALWLVLMAWGSMH